MYEQFFGFTQKPFNVTPDPRFLYLSPGHQEALASMIYGIRERRGFVSIIGEIGTGKTTLLHTLFKELSSDVKTVFIFNTKINFKQLLQNILIELEVPQLSESKALLLNQLNDFLIEKLSFNENVALIIDEAQNLSSSVLEELRMLSNLETTKEKLLQIVLVGQPELDYKLRSHNLRQLKQRIAINCYLTPLNSDEQIKYIQHRLHVANAKDRNIFSPEALVLICKHSQGIPRIINILCDNSLLSAFGKNKYRIDSTIVKEVIADYEGSRTPFIKPEKSSLIDNKSKPRFTNVFFISILFFFIIFIPLFLGITAYKAGPHGISYFFSSLFANLSTIKENATVNSINAVMPETLEQSKNTPLNVGKNPISYTSNDLKDSEIIATFNAVPPITLSQNSTARGRLLQFSTKQQDQENYRTYIASRGDMISSLALKEYGTINDSIFDIIKRANPEIANLDLIDIGQPVHLPSLTIENSVLETNNNTFTIHMGTFSAYNSARILHNRLLKNNYSITITPVNVTGKKKWYRVTVGNFADKTEALNFAKNIAFSDFPYKF